MELRKILMSCSLVVALLMAGCGKKEETKKVAFGDAVEELASSQIPLLDEELENFFEDDDAVEEFAFLEDDFDDNEFDLDEGETFAELDGLFDEDEFEDEDSFVAWNDESEIEELNFKTVQFDLNGNAIREDQSNFLKENIEAAKTAVAEGKTVIVQGHACQLGSPSYNIPLSEKRAEAIKKEMVKNGVPAEKIKTIGYGQEMPVVWSEKTDKFELISELAPNRRAEVTVG
jgi:outer membrane protein OmpA-like peptidoglycan-associated protein